MQPKVEVLNRLGLLIASRGFGSSGQPWLWRQVLGLRALRTAVLCWIRCNSATYPVNDSSVHVLARDPAPYDGAGRWWFRLRNLPTGNFYATQGEERREVAELLRRERPAAILCYFGEIAMRLLPVARRAGIPLIAYFHGEYLFLNNRWYRWSLYRCLRHFAAIIVVTEGERKWMMEHGVPGDKLHVIPCGAPTETFQPMSKDKSGPLRYVMASRLVDEKGCHLSIKAFAAIASDVLDAELHIYGDGPARQDLEQLVKALNLETRVFFHGYVEEQRLAEALPTYDIFIQHSLRKEGSPVSIVEAMACGLPVVATPVGGIADQIVDGQTGLLVAERDVPGMSTAMLRLARDSEMRRRFGRNGRDRAVQLYDAALLTKRLQRVVSDVVAAGRNT